MAEKLHVLILEDEDAIAAIIEDIVEDTAPSEVSVFNSVESAEKSLNLDLDLALLDINLTNGKSYDLALKLLKAKIPFAFVSGSRHSDMPEELRNSPFIAKPFRTPEIRKAVLDARDKKSGRHN